MKKELLLVRKRVFFNCFKFIIYFKEEAAKSPYESYVPTPVDEGDGKKKKKKKKKGDHI